MEDVNPRISPGHAIPRMSRLPSAELTLPSSKNRTLDGSCSYLIRTVVPGQRWGAAIDSNSLIASVDSF
jgi:hypothetical protein